MTARNCADCGEVLPRIRWGGVCFACMERQLRKNAHDGWKADVPGRNSNLTSREQLDRPSLSQHWYEELETDDDE